MNRQSCFRTPNTCGPCLSSDYVGEVGDANSMCLDLVSSSAILEDLLNSTLLCPNNCSGHGSCIYMNSYTNEQVESCSVAQSAKIGSCKAQCVCEEGYGMSVACDISDDMMMQKQSQRNQLITSLESLYGLQDVSSLSMAGVINGLLQAAQNPQEIDSSTGMQLLNLTQVLLNDSSQNSIQYTYLNNMPTLLDKIASSTLLQTTSSYRKLTNSSSSSSSSAQKNKVSSLLSSFHSYGQLVYSSLLPTEESVTKQGDTFKML